MANFYIKTIIVSGGGNEPSTLDFADGLNIVCGPSNTGKSYIIECLDFLFGSRKIRLDQNAGYDTVKVLVQVKGDGMVTFERKVDARKISVASSAKDIESGSYSIDGTKK